MKIPDNTITNLLHDFGIKGQPGLNIISDNKYQSLYRIKTQRSSYILKIYKSGSKTENQINQELDFISYLSVNGHPVPTIYSNKYGNKIISLSEGLNPPYGVLMKDEAGNHLEEFTPATLMEMSANQAAMHATGLKYKHYSSRGSYLKHMYAWRSMILGVLAPSGFSHFDYDASNILFDESKLTCILDFEGMRFGPLVVCIYHSLKCIYATSGDIDDLRLYINTYEASRRLNIFEKFILFFALSVHFRRPKRFVQLIQHDGNTVQA